MGRPLRPTRQLPRKGVNQRRKLLWVALTVVAALIIVSMGIRSRRLATNSNVNKPAVAARTPKPSAKPTVPPKQIVKKKPPPKRKQSNAPTPDSRIVETPSPGPSTPPPTYKQFPIQNKVPIDPALYMMGNPYGADWDGSGAMFKLPDAVKSQPLTQLPDSDDGFQIATELPLPEHCQSTFTGSVIVVWGESVGDDNEAANEMFAGGKAVVEEWKAKLPCARHRIVSTAECLSLADDYSAIEGINHLVENVMIPLVRVELCKLLALHHYGGVVHDIDVAPVDDVSWFHKLEENRLALFKDDDGSIDTSVMGAKANHACVEDLIKVVVDQFGAVQDMWLKMAVVDNFLVESVGSEAVVEGLSSVCSSSRRPFDAHFLRWSHGEGFWEGSGNVERLQSVEAFLGRELTAITTKKQRLMYYQATFAQQLEDTSKINLGDDSSNRTLPALVVNDVAMSPPLNPSFPEYFGAGHLLFDDNPSSAAMTGRPPASSEVGASMKINLVDMNHTVDDLSCLRLVRLSRDVAALQGVSIALYNDDGTVLAQSDALYTLDTDFSWQIPSEASEDAITKIVLTRTRPTQSLRLASLQFYSTPDCSGDPLVVNMSPPKKHTTPPGVSAKQARVETFYSKVLGLATQMDSTCPQGFSVGAGGHHWSLCTPLVDGCVALFLGSSTNDLALEKIIRSMFQCEVIVLTNSLASSHECGMHQKGQLVCRHYKTASMKGVFNYFKNHFHKASIDLLFVNLAPETTTAVLSELTQSKFVDRVHQLSIKFHIGALVSQSLHSSMTTLQIVRRSFSLAHSSTAIEASVVSIVNGAIKLPSKLDLVLVGKAMQCQAKAAGDIPRYLFTFPAASSTVSVSEIGQKRWVTMNRCVKHHVMTMDECKELARRSEDVKELWSVFEFPEVHLAFCKLLLLDHFGGVFHDPSVSPLVPLDQMVNFSKPRLWLGVDSKNVSLRAHVMVADRGNMCIRQALKRIAKSFPTSPAMQKELKEDMKQDITVRNALVGEAAIVAALTAVCHRLPKTGRLDISKKVWIPAEPTAAQLQYITAPQSQLYFENTTVGSNHVTIQHAELSHYRYPEIPHTINPAHYALDGNLETFAEVLPEGGQTASWGTILIRNQHFAIGSPHNEHPNNIAAFILYPPRNTRSSPFMQGVIITLYNGHHKVRVSPALIPDDGPTVVWNMTTEAPTYLVFDTVVVESTVGGMPLRIAEFQVIRSHEPGAGLPFRFRKDPEYFVDAHEKLVMRKQLLPKVFRDGQDLNVEAENIAAAQENPLWEMLQLLTTRTYNCPTGFFAENAEPQGASYNYLCKNIPSPTFVLIGSGDKMVDMAQNYYNKFGGKFVVVAVSTTSKRETNNTNIVVVNHQHDSKYLPATLTKANIKKIDNLHIDVGAFPNPFNLLEELHQQEMAVSQVTMGFTADTSSNETMTSVNGAIRTILERYHLAGSSHDNSASIKRPFHAPGEFQLTFVLREYIKETDCKWAHSGSIEPTMRSVWKTKELFSDSAEVMHDWRQREPCIEQQVVTDQECTEMASKISEDFFKTYIAVPVNVMRADMCRVLVVYFHGGMYRDLDVMWRRSVRAWLRLDQRMLLGNETSGGIVCNWFFGASPRNICFFQYFQAISKLFPNATREGVLEHMRNEPHAVHYITGPTHFTSHAKRCGTPVMSDREITLTDIHHHFGSQRWKKNLAYTSWLVDLARAMGQKYGDHYVSPRERGYIYRPNAMVLHKGLDTLPITAAQNVDPTTLRETILVAKKVTCNHPLNGDYAAEVFSPISAIDGSLDSYYESNGAPGLPSWTLTLETPLPIHTTPQNASQATTHLGAVRVFLPRDNINDRDIDHIQLFIRNAEGTIVAKHDEVLPKNVTTTKQRMLIFHWALPLNSNNSSGSGPYELKDITVEALHSPLRFAELQLVASDNATVFKILRDIKGEIALKPNQATEGDRALAEAAGRRLARSIGLITHACDNGHSIGDQHESGKWYLCNHKRLRELAHTEGCHALFAGAEETTLAMEQMVAVEYGCNVSVLDHSAPDYHGQPFKNKYLDIPNMRMYPYELGSSLEVGASEKFGIALIMKKLGISTLNVLRFTSEEHWHEILDDVLRLAVEKKIEEVVFQSNIHAANRNVKDTIRLATIMERMHEQFYLVYSRSHAAATIAKIPYAIHCCHKMSFVRRDLIDGPIVAPSTSKFSCPVATKKSIPRIMHSVQLSGGFDIVADEVMHRWRLMEPCATHTVLRSAQCLAMATTDQMKSVFTSAPFQIQEPLCLALGMYHYGGMFHSPYDAPPHAATSTIVRSIPWKQEVFFSKDRSKGLPSIVGVRPNSDRLKMGSLMMGTYAHKKVEEWHKDGTAITEESTCEVANELYNMLVRVINDIRGSKKKLEDDWEEYVETLPASKKLNAECRGTIALKTIKGFVDEGL